MKKLIIILYLTSISLFGCNSIPNMDENKHMIVTNIAYYHGKCYYTIRTFNDHYYSDIKLIGKCKQYQVGDTIKFIRK